MTKMAIGQVRKDKAPCKDCDRRCIGCHGSCADYQAFRNKIDADTAEVFKKRQQVYENKCYLYERMYK